MSRALTLAGVLALAGCSTGGEPPLTLDGLLQAPDARCAEARALAAGLVASDPDNTLRWRALEVAACAPVIAR